MVEIVYFGFWMYYVGNLFSMIIPIHQMQLQANNELRIINMLINIMNSLQ